MEYYVNDVEYIYLPDFAKIIGFTDRGVRYLVEHGNSIRPLKSYREGSKLYIKASELTEYPFMSAGKKHIIFHYKQQEDGSYKRIIGNELL